MLGLRRFLSGLMAAGDALHQLADTLHEARVTLEDRVTACRGDTPKLVDCTPAEPTEVPTPATKPTRRKS